MSYWPVEWGYEPNFHRRIETISSGLFGKRFLPRCFGRLFPIARLATWTPTCVHGAFSPKVRSTNPSLPHVIVTTYHSVLMFNLREVVRTEMLADMPIRKRLKEEILEVMLDPEVILFCNLRKLTFSDLENLNFASSAIEPLDNNPPPTKNKRKIHKWRAAHYRIGEYYSSTYYSKFLSNTVVCVPRKSDSTIRQLTRNISLNPKSTFCSWFHIPLYKVEQIVERVLTEKIITLSHHCWSEDKLQLKCELLVLGSLAVLSGVFTQFCQIPTLTNICATEHSTFFLRFVEFLHSIWSEYI
jgi:hypothetical protein